MTEYQAVFNFPTVMYLLLPSIVFLKKNTSWRLLLQSQKIASTSSWSRNKSYFLSWKIAFSSWLRLHIFFGGENKTLFRIIVKRSFYWWQFMSLFFCWTISSYVRWRTVYKLALLLRNICRKTILLCFGYTLLFWVIYVRGTFYYLPLSACGGCLFCSLVFAYNFPFM